MDSLKDNVVEVKFPEREFNVQSKSLPSEVQKETIERRVVLSDRDYEALGFILEMKFSAIEEIFEKFYKSTDESGSEVGFSYLKKRLVQLEQAGYLESIKAFSNKKRLYVATRDAYQVLKRVFPDRDYVKPHSFIDARTVVHDYLVLKMRLELEKRKGITSWISDRTLRKMPGAVSQLKGRYSPDGVYELPDGTKVAFEFEISTKAKIRYQEKIRKYVGWFREHRNDPNVFKKVHFVVVRDFVKINLEKQIGLNKDLFEIEKAQVYLPEIEGLK